MLPSRGVEAPPSRLASIPAVPTSSRWLARRRIALAAAGPRTVTEGKHSRLDAGIIHKAYYLNKTGYPCYAPRLRLSRNKII